MEKKNKKPSNPTIQEGWTLRDEAAMRAMMGLVSNFSGDVSANYETISSVSYKMADEMLKQREL